MNLNHLEFAKLELASKCLLKSAMEKVTKFKQNADSGQDTKVAKSTSSRANSSFPSNGANINGNHSNNIDEEMSIREIFAELRDNLARMKALSHDISPLQTNKNLSSRILDQIKTFELSVDGLHSSLRKVQLEFQQIINLKSRDDLLSLSTSPFETENSLISMRRRGKGAGSVSTNTTDALLKTRNILLETVQRSTGTLEHLAQSSLTIVNSQEDLKEQNTIVAASRHLLSKYGRREWTDRLLICLGLVFFFAVVGYIVQKRLF